uniref:Uncharacterized protein n=1 Tax=Rhizophora mucronata TaxID=61149 RepID=A0A2P2PIW2_RHIMU
MKEIEKNKKKRKGVAGVLCSMQSEYDYISQIPVTFGLSSSCSNNT